MKWVVVLVVSVGALGWGLSMLDPAGQRDPGLFGFGADEVPNQGGGPFGQPVGTSDVAGNERRCAAAAEDYPTLLAAATGRIQVPGLSPSDAAQFLGMVFTPSLVADAPPELRGDLMDVVEGAGKAADGSLMPADEALYVGAFQRFSTAASQRC